LPSRINNNLLSPDWQEEVQQSCYKQIDKCKKGT
jgi:hypothetical protein